MINPLSELLAIIHRDGGHYEAQHGTEKAVQDAMNKIHEMRAAMQEFVIELNLVRFAQPTPTTNSNNFWSQCDN